MRTARVMHLPLTDSPSWPLQLHPALTYCSFITYVRGLNEQKKQAYRRQAKE